MRRFHLPILDATAPLRVHSLPLFLRTVCSPVLCLCLGDGTQRDESSHTLTQRFGLICVRTVVSKVLLLCTLIVKLLTLESFAFIEHCMHTVLNTYTDL